MELVTNVEGQSATGISDSALVMSGTSVPYYKGLLLDTCIIFTRFTRKNWL